MSDPWELMLHHSYAGSPGLIFDQSPGRKNHGRGRGLQDSDYTADGQVARSGAVQFRDRGIIDVLPQAPWDSLQVIRAEFICRWDQQIRGILLDTDTFTFAIIHEVPWFNVLTPFGWVGHTMSKGNDPVIPFQEWMTLGVYFDFISGVAGFTLNGDEIERTDCSWMAAMSPPSKIGIGNSISDLDQYWRGAIDDVKVWRLDPKWVDGTFTNRPTDPRVRDCWDKWSDGLGNAFAADPECALRVASLIQAAVNGMIRRLSQSSRRARWEAAVGDYRRRWEGGDLDGVADALNSVIAEVGADLQLTTDPAIAALLNDPCVQRLVSNVPSIECDPAFSNMLRKTAAGLGSMP